MQNLQQIQATTIVALILFGMVMVAIGLYSYHRTKTMDAFLLGGRNIGAWVSSFAYGTSYFSAVIFIGYAGKHGWDIGVGSMWIGIGNAVLGCLLAWLLMAKRTRRMTHTLNSKTMPEFFEARYLSKSMKIFAAIIIFVFLVPYSAAVYKGLGSTFNTIFPSVSVNYCMLIIAVLTATYLVLGGYLATAYTDFIQGIIMIVGIVAMVVSVVNSQAVGGLAEGFRKLSQIPDNGDGVVGSQLVNIFGGNSWKFLCTNILLTSFGTWGLPQMVTKYYAIKDEKSVKQGTIIATLFCALIGCGAYFIGSLSRVVLNNQLPQGGKDAVIPEMLINGLGGNGFTVVILAVILILLLSASMSTLASVVLTSSSAISVDLLPEFSKKIDDKKQVSLSRVLCFVFVILSYIFATMNISIIVNIMSFSWGVVAGCFVGPYIWGICWKGTTKKGAWAGLIAGLLTVAIPTLYMTITESFSAAVSKAPEMGVSAMAISAAVVPLVSLFTKKMEKEHLEKIFK